MDINLKNDLENIDILLEKVTINAFDFLKDINEIATFPKSTNAYTISKLNKDGLGGEKTLEEFMERFYKGIVSCAGSKYFGFVTGGTTPAALMGDWLVSTFDQNATGRDNSSAAKLEEETINLLKQLLGLPETYSGTFVTGATMANFVGLAIGRQWLANELGVNIAIDGLYSIPPIRIVSSTPHSSISKAMSMLGMGRKNMHYIPTIDGREAIDVEALESYLKKLNGEPCIVVANAGTVNTVDFDDLKQIGELKKKYNFFLHVDGAFGGFASCSIKYKKLVEGIEAADSITIDAHKWLNVPYDSAMQFTKHPKLQLQVFQNNAVYLGELSDNPDFVHLTPENSRRLRALPAWFTLKAYGQNGYQEIIERNCDLAQLLSKKIDESKNFRLLSTTRLNVVCFTINLENGNVKLEQIQQFLNLVNKDGRAFFTQTVYKGIAGIRAAISNWRTEEKDIEIAWEVLNKAYKSYYETITAD
ncbi:pyridoxal phosphate-dependent decarboxylase family protein [Clostridium botulinum]|uniref:pyridoxal phosphate-dependent decarboxylase family protein n=1 Tax=Clostridium botulinum TaxID=1491 RepID=UPI001E512EF1|nr:aminotransferase class I/II-fold pyridoxal phosphate-dependent enzyme [Clostridium botulinum]MCC5438714.1 aminotransferase class I/II-fold pyridoxal phosphate-dependent enzyme [Clostridium botulinum]NFR56946.1 aspartate aminotransferase family protein [Clostridium botulinum]